MRFRLHNLAEQYFPASPRTATKSHFYPTSAFTLIEVVVSIAILAVIVLSLGHIFATVSESTTRAKKNILLDQTARRVFEMLATDISQAYVRTDIPFHVHSIINTNDQLSFVTASRFGLDGGDYRYLANARDSYAASYSLENTTVDNLFYINRKSPNLKGNSPDHAAKLFLAASDFYHNENSDIFEPQNLQGSEWSTSNAITTSFLSTADGSQVVLLNSFFTAYTNDGNEYTNTDFPDKTIYPSYVDVELELMTRRDWNLYDIFESNGQIAKAEELIEKNARRYHRRFPLNTFPVESLELNTNVTP